jgi:tripartite ATP-independent transporter DctM subunit
MEWPLALLVIFGCLVILMATGMPVAFAFLFTCSIGALLFWGGVVGLQQLAMSFYSSVTTFSLLPAPLFILMGNIIFESGVGMNLVDAGDKILGRLPGRLSLLAIGAGTLLGTMIGISGGSIAILGRSLVPEMTKRGYQKPMSLGPIVASGTLATMIPPSALAVFLGAIGRVSIGSLLVAIIIPGLMLAALFAAYVITRCRLQPSVAPSYAVARVSLLEKLIITCRYVLPVGFIIFAVIGVVFMGVATPSEAAALGAVACFILAAVYRRFNWKMIKKSSVSTVQITVMVFMIVVGSISFSRVLASSGAAAGLAHLAATLPVHPIVIVIATQLVVIFLGCFVDPASIVMIVAPLFMPIVTSLGFDPIWYSVILLINIQLGLITPPFGLDCYTMKALVPKSISMGDIFRSSMPFCAIGYLVMAILMIFPQLTIWLPARMAS